MSPDVMCRCFTAILLEVEGDVGRALIVLEAWWCWQYRSSRRSTALHLLQVRGASSVRYQLGSITLALTSASTPSTTYTQPFGSNGVVDAKSFGNNVHDLPAVVIGWWNRSGIFVIFQGVEESSCQHCGLCTTEVKSLHAVGQNSSLHWDSRLGRGEVE
jgi:hypothetical protein